MASCSSRMNVLIDPEYIQFLLDPDLEFSCYFVVGNPELAAVEKIGVVRKMLAAHSEVFRTQLMNRKWKSEEPEHINDIFPETFRNLLRFVYGFDMTASMSFDDADDLLYVADRYIMPKLKAKLATRLTYLLDYTNICSLLTNPACARALELQKEMNMILQHQTDKILAQPQFLNCCPEAFVRILEEEAINVSELDLWRAALKWAKKRVQTEDPKLLRQHLEKPLKHIRICAMPLDVFWDEVAVSGIFTEEEKLAVGHAYAKGVKPKTLASVSDKMEARTKTVSYKKHRGQWFDESEVIHADLGTVREGDRFQGRSCTIYLNTAGCPVVIKSLVCQVEESGRFNFKVAIKVEKEPRPPTTRSHEPSITVERTHETTRGERIHLQLSTDEREVTLSKFTRYSISISCDRNFKMFRYSTGIQVLRHFSLSYGNLADHRNLESAVRNLLSYDFSIAEYLQTDGPVPNNGYEDLHMDGSPTYSQLGNYVALFSPVLCISYSTLEPHSQ